MSLIGDHPAVKAADPLSALFHTDLLSIAAALRLVDARLLSHRVAKTVCPTVPMICCGGEQARAFLGELVIRREFLDALRGNPLIKRLGLNPGVLEPFLGWQLLDTAQFAADGEMVGPNQPAMRLAGPAFGVTAVLPALERILTRQSHAATEARDELRRKRSWFPDRSLDIIEASTGRNENATVAAYLSRGRTIGGYERWICHLDPTRAKEVNKIRHHDCDWRVRAQALRSRFDRSHDRTFLKAFTLEEVAALRAGGILALEADDCYRNTLLAFALDGISDLLPARYGYGTDPRIVERVAGLRPVDGMYLCDSAYQSWIAASPPPGAAYGRRGVDTQAAKHKVILDLLGRFRHVGITRAKYFRIPLFLVDSATQLRKLVDVIASSVAGTILFRGQTRHYDLGRPGVVRTWLYGLDSEDELSLGTAASRARFDFDAFLPDLQYQLQGLLYDDLDPKRFDRVVVGDDGLLRFADDEVMRRNAAWRGGFQTMTWDVLAMGLAQHYGVPTDGLDLTEDLDVAVWMALMEYRHAGEGDRLGGSYQRRRASDRLPIVYVVAAPDSFGGSLREFAGCFPSLRSVRQERQKAYLYFGGWGLHTNITAEDVLAGVYLSNSIDPKLTKQDVLFPPPHDDPLFAHLLDLRNEAMASGARLGWSSILNYQNS